MTDCIVCGERLLEPHVGVHAACLAQRLPQDAALAVAWVLAVALAPVVLVWAG
jgi:hypothetical protein